MSQWQLVDGSRPAASPEEFPQVAICSEKQLREELARLREREPGIVSLEGPDGLALQIGIGGPLAGLRLFQSAKMRLIVLADHRSSEKRVDFAAEEDTLAFWPDELMPIERAIDLIVHFYNHCWLPDGVSCKEWDESAKRWSVRPAKRAETARESNGLAGQHQPLVATHDPAGELPGI